MALGSHLITVRRLEKYINDVIGKKANLPDTSKTIIGNISQINSDLSDISEDITLLATLNGASSINTWTVVPTTDNVRLDSFRSFIVSLVKSDGTVMQNVVVPYAQMSIARYNSGMIACAMPVITGLTTGTLYGMCATHSITAFAMWINHANYSLKVYGCK